MFIISLLLISFNHFILMFITLTQVATYKTMIYYKSISYISERQNSLKMKKNKINQLVIGSNLGYLF